MTLTYDATAPDWQRLERQLARYTLTPGPRNAAVEAMAFPGLVNAYRATCPTAGRAPTQRDYEDWVVALVTSGAVAPHAFLDVDAVRARAGRAYISLVVQHHAYLVLLDAFGAVAWDDDLDMRYGVDLVVIGDDAVAVGLALRAPTPRSRELAARKQRRYERLPFEVYPLEVEPRAYMAGPFWLYRPERLRLVVTEAFREYWEARVRNLTLAAAGAYDDGRRRKKASRRDFMDGAEAALAALRGGSPTDGAHRSHRTIGSAHHARGGVPVAGHGLRLDAWLEAVARPRDQRSAPLP